MPHFVTSTSTSRPLPLRVLAALALLAAVLTPAQAGEFDLKTINSIAPEKKTRKGEGPYVALQGGTTSDQSVNFEVEGFQYMSRDRDGDAIFGIEVGNRWRDKKFPLDYNAEFQAMFWSGELAGYLPPDEIPLLPSDSNLTSFMTDFFAASFLVNGEIGLNLRQFRPRIGKFFSSFRPFVGGGVGGTQLWFRDPTLVTRGGDTAPPTSTLFATDTFVFTYQWFAGLEFMINDNFSAFFEHRRVITEDFDDSVNDFKTSSNQAGIRFLYDKEKEE
ncbi:MAG: hypothetical protein AAF591_01040 [Verrucomicrobiota bacterium]